MKWASKRLAVPPRDARRRAAYFAKRTDTSRQTGSPKSKSIAIPVSFRKSSTNAALAFGCASNSAYTGAQITNPPTSVASSNAADTCRDNGSADQSAEMTLVSIAVLILHGGHAATY